MIIVVSGLPRSGTSMMMQVLQAGGLQLLIDAARSPDESNPRGYFEYEPVKALARSSDWVADAEGKAIKVIAQLVPHLPDGHEYAVLFMQRDLDEILASQSMMLSRMDRKGSALNPQVLKQVFERQLSSAIAYADEQPRMRRLIVEHAGMLADPDLVIESVQTFLGVSLDVAKAAAVVDPALHRERSG